MTRPEDLANEINDVLAAYRNGVNTDIEDLKKETAQALVKELKRTSPKRTGKYAKGWTYKKSGRTDSTLYTVHNKPKYMLTHLLEHGHAKRGGGRVAAKVHIAPAEQKYVRKYLEDVRRAIEE